MVDVTTIRDPVARAMVENLIRNKGRLSLRGQDGVNTGGAIPAGSPTSYQQGFPTGAPLPPPAPIPVNVPAPTPQTPSQKYNLLPAVPQGSGEVLPYNRLDAAASAADATTGVVTRAQAEQMIREEAAKRGIDANVAVRVARKEGLNAVAQPSEAFQSKVTRNGVREPSYGVFQVNKNGVGNGFQGKTGFAIDDTSPAAERARIQVALDHAADKGWGAWYGAGTKNDGSPTISNRQGLADAKPAGITATRASYAATGNTDPAVSAATAQATQTRTHPLTGEALPTSYQPPGVVAENLDPVPTALPITYANTSAVRDQRVSDWLTGALAYAGQKEGVEFRITSGGQPSTGPNRVGSRRHDEGNAADLQILYEGRPLDITNPADEAKINAVNDALREMGVSGTGGGAGYMGPTMFHVGSGEDVVWGPGGRAVTAPEVLSNWHKNAGPVGSKSDALAYAAPVPRLNPRNQTSDPVLQTALDDALAKNGRTYNELTPETRQAIRDAGLNLPPLPTGQNYTPRPDLPQTPTLQDRALGGASFPASIPKSLPPSSADSSSSSVSGAPPLPTRNTGTPQSMGGHFAEIPSYSRPQEYKTVTKTVANPDYAEWQKMASAATGGYSGGAQGIAGWGQGGGGGGAPLPTVPAAPPKTISQTSRIPVPPLPRLAPRVRMVGGQLDPKSNGNRQVGLFGKIGAMLGGYGDALKNDPLVKLFGGGNINTGALGNVLGGLGGFGSVSPQASQFSASKSVQGSPSIASSSSGGPSAPYSIGSIPGVSSPVTQYSMGGNTFTFSTDPNTGYTTYY